MDDSSEPEQLVGSPLVAKEGGPAARATAGSLSASTLAQASPWAIFAGVAAFALSVAILPNVESYTLTPKYAVMLVVAAVGFVPLVRSLRLSRQAVPSWAALGFLAVGLASALLSTSPATSIVGQNLWGTGWLMWLGCAGAFGIGMQLRTKADVDWLIGGFTGGAVVNALVAIWQAVAVPDSLAFGPYQGNQADGLFGNPVHLEAYLLGVIGIVTFRYVTSIRSALKLAPLLLLLSVALETTDERFAVILLPLLAIALVVLRQKGGLVAAATVLVGYGIGYVGAGTSLGSRLQQGTASPGFTLRLDMWKLGLHALAHHPLIGSGPGMFEAAAAPFITRPVARLLGPGTMFTDAHDVVIEVLATTGILGFACFAVWVLGSVARARNALLLFVLAAGAVELVEPLNVGITPLAFLALGATAAPVTAAALVRTRQNRRGSPASGGTAAIHPMPAMGPWWRLATTLLLAAAMLFGTTMLLGDAAMAKAPPNGYVLADARRANQLLPYWPESAFGMALYYEYEAAASHRSLPIHRYRLLARRYLDEVVARAPFDPLVFVALGEVDLKLDDLSGAETVFRKGLAADPESLYVLHGLAVVAVERQQWASAAHWYAAAIAIARQPSLKSAYEIDLRAVEHDRPPPAQDG